MPELPGPFISESEMLTIDLSPSRTKPYRIFSIIFLVSGSYYYPSYYYPSPSCGVIHLKKETIYLKQQITDID